jgi:hypothetical protein
MEEALGTVTRFCGTDVFFTLFEGSIGEIGHYYRLDLRAALERASPSIDAQVGTHAPLSECVNCGSATDHACELCKTPYCDSICQTFDWEHHREYCHLLKDHV